jgi:hypothetical protein
MGAAQHFKGPQCGKQETVAMLTHWNSGVWLLLQLQALKLQEWLFSIAKSMVHSQAPSASFENSSDTQVLKPYPKLQKQKPYHTQGQLCFQMTDKAKIWYPVA